MAKVKVTTLFDQREIAERVEELARMAVDRLPSNFVIVGLLDPMIARPEGGPSSDMQRYEG
jgi:hypothetical protein